jgi:ribonuclease BN (tRNA processing enzyme)
MTELIVGDDGIFGPDLRARCELPMSVDVYVARGGAPPREKPRPVVRELASGEEVECGDFTVRTRAVIHAQPILECFGYRLENEGKSFVYSGDAGPCAAMHELAHDCDVLVHMVHFLSGTALSDEMAKRNGGHLEVAQLAAEANVRNLVISHVTEQMDVPGIRERVIREMGEIYTGNIFFGEDLMEIPVSGPQAAKLD